MSASDPAIELTKLWLERVVVGLNLCPFAHAELRADRVRYRSLSGGDLRSALEALAEELEQLAADEEIGTTLLVLPGAFEDFEDYLDLVDLANELIRLEGHEGRFQLASFHPEYCFADAEPDDASNLSNRSPHPMLHLLREDEIARVLASVAHPEEIPTRNKEVCQKLGFAGMRALMATKP